jgi:uncharacterized protein (TIGR00369 family)
MSRSLAVTVNALGLYAIALVLAAAFAAQFLLGELPCPLCLLQRIQFALLAIGPILNIRRGPRPSHYALSLLVAAAGAAVAMRQILLHILPGDPGYGSALLGYHYYTWAFVGFVAAIILTAVQGLVDGTLPLNTIAETLGYDVCEVASGRAAVTLVPNDRHLNPAGTVHGGLAATLLDSCMGLAVLSTLEKGFDQTTVEFKISLLRPITPQTGPIKAEGVVLNRGRRVGTAEGRITDRQGRLLAHGTTTCLIFQS